MYGVWRLTRNEAMGLKRGDYQPARASRPWGVGSWFIFAAWVWEVAGFVRVYDLMIMDRRSDGRLDQGILYISRNRNEKPSLFSKL